MRKNETNYADALKEHKFTTQAANGVEIYDIEVVLVASIDNAPTADDWKKYSDELWKNAYERGQADAYEKAKQKVTVSVKVGNQTVETIEINGDAVRWSSSSL